MGIPAQREVALSAGGGLCSRLSGMPTAVWTGAVNKETVFFLIYLGGEVFWVGRIFYF